MEIVINQAFFSPPPGFGSNLILTGEIAPEGFVKRSFSIRKIHINRVKALTVKANNAGHRLTQDDIINSIFDDYFNYKNIQEFPSEFDRSNFH